jgi:hypothetical protein
MPDLWDRKSLWVTITGWLDDLLIDWWHPNRLNYTDYAQNRATEIRTYAVLKMKLPVSYYWHFFQNTENGHIGLTRYPGPRLQHQGAPSEHWGRRCLRTRSLSLTISQWTRALHGTRDGLSWQHYETSTEVLKTFFYLVRKVEKVDLFSALRYERTSWS